MKLSVSLSEEDVAILDEYVRTEGLPSRSAAVQQALRRLAQKDLQHAYSEAYAEWDASGERAWWETSTADGLDDAAR